MQPRGLRNNNPGNIRKSTDLFVGEVIPSRDKEFKQFETAAYGYRAMFKILKRYILNYHLDTVRKIVTRWAPPSENATEAYVKAVSDCSGIPADEPVRADDRKTMIAVACGISRVENGTEAVMNDVRDGWNLL